MRHIPEDLEVIAQDWKDDIARLEECQKILTNEYLPQIASLNAKLTESLIEIKALEDRVKDLEEENSKLKGE